MPVLLAHAIEDSIDIFGISGGGGSTPPNHPPRYATVCVLSVGQEECFEDRAWHHDGSLVCPILFMVHVIVCIQLMNDGKNGFLKQVEFYSTNYSTFNKFDFHNTPTWHHTKLKILINLHSTRIFRFKQTSMHTFILYKIWNNFGG